MRGTLSLLPTEHFAPRESRSEEYWSAFVDAVDARIASQKRNVPARSGMISEALGVLHSLRLRTALTLAAGFAAVAIAVVLLRSPAPETVPSRQLADTEARDSVRSDDQRLSRYFRRSQTLLVGLTNKKPTEGRTIDLEPERDVSRELANETRAIRQTLIDQKSTRLVDDLEKIFIEVANTSPRAHPREFEMIRGGIREENLLFKVRMAQAGYFPEQEMR